jgi:hypothetical protein
MPRNSPLSLSSKAATPPTDVQFVENLSINGTANPEKYTHVQKLPKDERFVSLSMEELVLFSCAEGVAVNLATIEKIIASRAGAHSSLARNSDNTNSRLPWLRLTEWRSHPCSAKVLSR